MTGRGRPKKGEGEDSRQKIVDAAVKIISEEGAGAISVRRIIAESGLSSGTFYYFFKDRNDLMMSFVRDPGFDTIVLRAPETDVIGRVCEMYGILIKRYMSLGMDFMRQFYTTDNTSLASYMGDGSDYGEDTVMHRCLTELSDARGRGLITGDVEEMTADVCTIVKGCVFDQCLTGRRDAFDTMKRIITAYLRPHLVGGAE